MGAGDIREVAQHIQEQFSNRQKVLKYHGLAYGLRKTVAAG